MALLFINMVPRQVFLVSEPYTGRIGVHDEDSLGKVDISECPSSLDPIHTVTSKTYNSAQYNFVFSQWLDLKKKVT